MDKEKIASQLVKLAKEIISSDRQYRRDNERSLWIRVNSNPSPRMTIEEAIKEAKRMDKLMTAQLKKIEKMTDAYVGVSKGNEIIEGNEQYKWVSKTAKIDVRGIEEGKRLYQAVEELGFDKGSF